MPRHNNNKLSKISNRYATVISIERGSRVQTSIYKKKKLPIAQKNTPRAQQAPAGQKVNTHNIQTKDGVTKPNQSGWGWGVGVGGGVRGWGKEDDTHISEAPWSPHRRTVAERARSTLLHEVVGMVRIFFETFGLLLHALFDFENRGRLSLIVLVAAWSAETTFKEKNIRNVGMSNTRLFHTHTTHTQRERLLTLSGRNHLRHAFSQPGRNSFLFVNRDYLKLIIEGKKTMQIVFEIDFQYISGALCCKITTVLNSQHSTRCQISFFYSLYDIRPHFAIKKKKFWQCSCII